MLDDIRKEDFRNLVVRTVASTSGDASMHQALEHLLAAYALIFEPDAGEDVQERMLPPSRARRVYERIYRERGPADVGRVELPACLQGCNQMLPLWLLLFSADRIGQEDALAEWRLAQAAGVRG